MSIGTPSPDPTNPDLLTNLRAYLIAQGLVRDPRDATKQATLPPLWINPRFGCPAPGEAEGLDSEEVAPLTTSNGLVAAIDPMTDTPSARFEGFLRYNHVQFTIRARTSKPILALENSIRAAINDRRGWMMQSVEVNESLLYRGLQPVDRSNLGFTYQCEYQFCLFAPYAAVGQ